MKINFQKLPKGSGVYLFKNKRGDLIYIGKAVNLQKRIKSYFQKTLLEEKTQKMVEEIEKVETIRTESEFEALLLEASLIKKEKPKYNTRWRDDKRPLYIKITAEEFPKILLTRQEEGKATYFGPFPSSKIVRETLGFLRKIFPFCSNKKIGKKPCFYSHLKLCHPCPNLIVSLPKPQRERLKKKYQQNIAHLKRVLRGQAKEVLKNLQQEMEKKAQNLQFEEAQRIKKQKEKLEYLITPRFSVSDYLKNPNLYEDLRARELQELSCLIKPRQTRGLTLDRIEGYDVSNILGREATGAMVVFLKGEAAKSEYRKFKIKTKEAPDDLAMIKEVLRRRLKHKEWPSPDLILIDGGAGQLKAAWEIIQKYQAKIPVIALAKREEEIYLSLRNPPLKILKRKLPKNAPALKLLQRIRDEAHRFAKRYHLFLRKKNMLYLGQK